MQKPVRAGCKFNWIDNRRLNLPRSGTVDPERILVMNRPAQNSSSSFSKEVPVDHPKKETDGEGHAPKKHFEAWRFQSRSRTQIGIHEPKAR